MSSLYFSNVQIKKDVQYFLYIGELKNYGLNLFLKNSLRRIFDCDFEFIAIVPDVFEQYNYENIMVINPLVDDRTKTCGENIHCRVSANQFMGSVSANKDIHSLIDTILENQNNLFLYMYESISEMTLDTIPGVTLLGPDKKIAAMMNNKETQLTGLGGILPLVEFQICKGYDDLITQTTPLWEKWTHGIFVTKTFSAAGINSVVAYSKKDISQKFSHQESTYLITRFLPHTHDPTVLGVVANEDQVYIAGVADQRIENGNRFTGSSFPSVLSKQQRKTLEDYTRKAGTWLAGHGYRGIFGCDYIVTPDGDIFFLEINARKQGTTIEFCCSLDQMLPRGAANLPELEFYAVTENRFPENTIAVPDTPEDMIHWGTFNYKVHKDVRTQNYIPQSSGELDAFEKIATKKLKKDFLILEHAGSDFIVASGAFIARIVALGHNRKSVAQGIEQGCKTIELTFTEID